MGLGFDKRKLISIQNLLRLVMIFPPTHNNLIVFNVFQFHEFILLHTIYELMSRWKLSYYCGLVDGPNVWACY